MAPAGMVYNGKCATDQAQRRGVKRSAGPYTGLFYPHLRATELGMRVESALNIHATQFALHSPGSHQRWPQQAWCTMENVQQIRPNAVE